MEKSLNLLLQDFEDGLINYINSNPLPVKAKLLCLESVMPGIMSAMKKASKQIVEKERIALEKATEQDK